MLRAIQGTPVRKNGGRSNYRVRSIVSVYINGRAVQDVLFTDLLVNSIGFHWERFKAKSYLL